VKVLITNDVFGSINKRDNTYTSRDAEAMCMHASGGNTCSMLILADNVSPGVIAHECWHAIYRMLTGLDVHLENETVAYHLGYLVNETHTFIAKLKAEGKLNAQSKVRPVRS
jgi:hypothetical protein